MDENSSEHNNLSFLTRHAWIREWSESEAKNFGDPLFFDKTTENRDSYIGKINETRKSLNMWCIDLCDKNDIF